MVSVMGWRERLDEVRLAAHSLNQADTIHNFDKIIPRAQVISILNEIEDPIKIKIISEQKPITGPLRRSIIIFSFRGSKKDVQSMFETLESRLGQMQYFVAASDIAFLKTWVKS